MRLDQIRQAALEVAETAIHGAAARRWLRIDGVDLTDEDETALKAELRVVAEGVARDVAGLAAAARSAADPGDWHKVHDEDYEDAVMRAAGAMIGYTAGKSESFRWTQVVTEAFRGAVAEAFNRGYETGRAVNV